MLSHSCAIQVQDLESILHTSLHHSDSDSIMSYDSEAFSPSDLMVEDALSPATDYEYFEKSPFVPHSPEAIHQADQMIVPDRSRSNSSDPNETTFFVRRSMLENRKKRKRPSCCSLSILEPGTTTRKVIHIEEVPITCKRLIIRHQIAGYEKVIELPEILATAPKRTSMCQTNIVKEETIESTIEITENSPKKRPPERPRNGSKKEVKIMEVPSTRNEGSSIPDTSQYNFTVI